MGLLKMPAPAMADSWTVLWGDAIGRSEKGGLFMRFAILFLCLLGLSACGNIGDDLRYQFGVSATQGPTAPSVLAWKANQICTGGYQVVHQETVRAEDGKQIVDMHLRCNPYSPSFDPMSWPAIF